MRRYQWPDISLRSDGSRKREPIAVSSVFTRLGRGAGKHPQSNAFGIHFQQVCDRFMVPVGSQNADWK